MSYEKVGLGWNEEPGVVCLSTEKSREICFTEDEIQRRQPELNNCEPKKRWFGLIPGSCTPRGAERGKIYCCPADKPEKYPVSPELTAIQVQQAEVFSSQAQPVVIKPESDVIPSQQTEPFHFVDLIGPLVTIFSLGAVAYFATNWALEK